MVRSHFLVVTPRAPSVTPRAPSPPRLALVLCGCILYWLASCWGLLLCLMFFFVLFIGRPLSVREDRPKAAREPRVKTSKGSTTNPMPEGVVSTTCLFVGNLAFECTDDELMAAFSLPSCTPVSAVIQMSGRNGGRSRGFGL